MHRHPKQAFTCRYCGSTFYDWLSQKPIFCSVRCSRIGIVKPDLERFWSKVNKGEGCWLWVGKLNHSSYGRFWMEGREMMAHRYSFEITYSQIPDFLSVLHSCDNPPCCNPDHLFLGTIADNNFDMRSKDRHARGERHGHAKLSQEEVLEIRRLSREGIAHSQIRGMIGNKISRQSVSRILSGGRWAHLL